MNIPKLFQSFLLFILIFEDDRDEAKCCKSTINKEGKKGSYTGP